MTSIAEALFHVAPTFLDTLSDAELAATLWDLDLWLRPEQRVPRRPFSTFGCLAGRGYGKTLAIAWEINRRAEAGELLDLALMGPTETRVDEVQIKMLVALSPPWFKATATDGTVVWPNGTRATVYTSIAPERPRSGNHDVSWLCELVAWPNATRAKAFENIATATRVGRAQLFWDTTSKGRNEVIQALLAENRSDPTNNIVVRGTTFDNPLLSRAYLRRVFKRYAPITSRRAREELLGEAFNESAGALWQQAWIDDHRVDLLPEGIAQDLIACDPALSDHPDADETGLVRGCRDSRGHCYVTADLSGRMRPDAYAEAIVDAYEDGAAGAIIERNHLGDAPRTLVALVAKRRGLRVEVLPRDAEGKPFPRREPGTIWIREIVSRASKGERANAPASLYQEGEAHHVGTHAELEDEQTTWEPDGKSESPNRLDAACMLLSELAGLHVPGARKPRSTCCETKEAAGRLRKLLQGRRLGI